MKFTTTILQTGKNTCGIVVPPAVVESLGAGKKPPVTVTINGVTYRSSIAVMGGDFMVGVSAENRAKTGVQGGETHEITIELDTQPRVVEVPTDFADALNKSPQAKSAFEKMSYSHKSRHVLVINDAKTPETRVRRIEKAIEMLLEGK